MGNAKGFFGKRIGTWSLTSILGRGNIDAASVGNRCKWLFR